VGGLLVDEEVPELEVRFKVEELGIIIFRRLDELDVEDFKDFLEDLLVDLLEVFVVAEDRPEVNEEVIADGLEPSKVLREFSLTDFVKWDIAQDDSVNIHGLVF